MCKGIFRASLVSIEYDHLIHGLIDFFDSTLLLSDPTTPSHDLAPQNLFTIIHPYILAIILRHCSLQSAHSIKSSMFRSHQWRVMKISRRLTKKPLKSLFQPLTCDRIVDTIWYNDSVDYSLECTQQITSCTSRWVLFHGICQTHPRFPSRFRCMVLPNQVQASSLWLIRLLGIDQGWTPCKLRSGWLLVLEIEGLRPRSRAILDECMWCLELTSRSRSREWLWICKFFLLWIIEYNERPLSTILYWFLITGCGVGLQNVKKWQQNRSDWGMKTGPRYGDWSISWRDWLQGETPAENTSTDFRGAWRNPPVLLLVTH
jgi:hypothetical protein